MDAEQWERVQQVFHGALALPAAERPAYLQAMCADADTRSDVERLLAADSSASPLDADTALLALELLGGTGAVRLGDCIGPYRLVTRLGEGGSGVVYLAERDDIGAVVAIKLLRDAWVTQERRDWFLAEQRALARLTHPCIARILDSGVHEGLPWFAMELVQGPPLDEYCRARQLGSKERLDLILRVCDAVQYAHGRLIVHRDLKPSNILVTAEGVPKLLDFGIARSLGPGGGPASHDALRILTPGYAAPEELRGEPVGVQADVYSVGATLAALIGEVTGPFPRSDEVRSVVTKATADDPADRYPTMAALAADLHALLRWRAVSAVDTGLLHRSRLFVRRHRRAVSVSAVVTALTVALTGYYSWQLAQSRAQIVTEAARTTRMLSFVLGLFEGATGGAPPTELRVLTLLDRGVREAEGLAGEPLLQAEIHRMLAEIYGELGDLERAETLLVPVVDVRRSRLGEGHRETLTASLQLAELRRAQARVADARTLAEGVLRVVGRADDPLHARALMSLGRVQQDLGEFAASAATLEQAIAAFERREGRESELADALTALSETRFYVGDLASAETLNQRALTLLRATRGNGHPDVAHALLTSSAIAAATDRSDAAYAATREALGIFTRWFGEDHPESAAATVALGQLLARDGALGDALPMLRRAVAIQERVFGERHPRSAFAQNEYGLAAFRAGELAAASVAFERAAAGYAMVSSSKPQAGVSLANLGSVHLAEGANKQAERRFRDALAIYAQSLPDNHLNVAIARSKLGRALLRQKLYCEATTVLRAADVALRSQAGEQGATWLATVQEDLVALGRVARCP